MTQNTETVAEPTTEDIAVRSQNVRNNRGVSTWTFIIEFERTASWGSVKQQLFDAEESPFVFAHIREIGEEYYKANTVAATNGGQSASVTVEASTHEDGQAQWLRVYVDARPDHETSPSILSTLCDYVLTEFAVTFEFPSL